MTGKRFSIKTKMLATSIIPMVVLLIVSMLLASSYILKGMEREVLSGLQASAKFYKQTKLSSGDRYSENDLEDELKAVIGYDFTWFDGDTRESTSIIKSDQSRPIGTQAAPEVIEQVLNKGKSYTSVSTDVNGQKYCVAYEPVEDRDGNVIGMAFCGTPKGGVVSYIQRSITKLVVIVVILFILAQVVVVFSSSSMINVIQEAGGALNKLANGRFEKVDRYLDRNDELGDMLRNTNDLIDKLSGVVMNLKQAVDLVHDSSDHMSGVADQISKTADSVTGAVEEIANGATTQANDIQNVVDSVREINDAITQVAETTHTLEQVTNNMEHNSKQSESQLNDLSIASENMTHSITDIQEKVSATGDAVERINEKVAVINDIAAQTNMLSLNASIEAARAGEAGRGFAVVADEIRQLADNSAQAAKDIQDEMAILKRESQSAVEQAKEVKQETGAQQKTIQATIGGVNNLITDIAEDINDVHLIAQEAKVCEDSKQTVMDAVSNLSAVSQQNAASAQETAAAMEELDATVLSMSESADSLKTVASDLETAIQFFQI
ncbi:MAG: cache domain-containing protein [Lachnospiraceae bacterium]|nr:cache domain-containing protein [Lachnospiraceae bacterium]